MTKSSLDFDDPKIETANRQDFSQPKNAEGAAPMNAARQAGILEEFSSYYTPI